MINKPYYYYYLYLKIKIHLILQMMVSHFGKNIKFYEIVLHCSNYISEIQPKEDLSPEERTVKEKLPNFRFSIADSLDLQAVLDQHQINLKNSSQGMFFSKITYPEHVLRNYVGIKRAYVSFFKRVTLLMIVPLP